MIDWAGRLREYAGRDDGSMVHRAAVQARSAIERSRAAWGERGVPWEMRSAGPPPEEEWVWLGEAIVGTCQDRADLTVDPELLTFRIREETPIEAAIRLDRFRVALRTQDQLPPPRWLALSGAPFLARPAETLLAHAFRDWESDLEERWLRVADERALRHLERKGSWPRKIADDLVTALNRARTARFIGVVRTAYAPDGDLAALAGALSPGDRLAVFDAIVEQRGRLISPADLAPLLAEEATRARAAELAERLEAPSDPGDQAAG
jgi:hypothetical protein